MSNPLLQPNDRFRRPGVVDPEGKNRFADEGPASESTPVDRSNPLAAPVDASQPAYVPQYQTTYAHRGVLVLVLGGLGFVASWGVLLISIQQFGLGISLTIVGIALSLASVVLGYQELTGMSAGAIDASGRNRALLGYRLGLAGLVLGFGFLAGLVVQIWRGIIEWT
jgi:hypothetical protein